MNEAGKERNYSGTPVVALSSERFDSYGAARAKVPVKFRLAGGRVRYRRPWKVVLYSVATLGLYAIYWNFTVARSIKRTTGVRAIKPGLDLALMVLTAGLYGLVVQFRCARRIHAASLFFERSHRDLSASVLGWNLLAPLTLGLTALISMYQLQRQLNRFADLANERERVRAEREDPPRLSSPVSAARLAVPAEPLSSPMSAAG